MNVSEVDVVLDLPVKSQGVAHVLCDCLGGAGCGVWSCVVLGHGEVLAVSGSCLG